MDKLNSKGASSFTIFGESEAIEIFTSLIKDEFETNKEYMSRIKSTVERLGWFRIGKVKIKKENYDINIETIKLLDARWADLFSEEPIYEKWVKNNYGFLWKIDSFPKGYSLWNGLPQYLKITDVDRDTAKALYENQGEDGYLLVMKIDIDKSGQALVVNKIQLITGWKTFDVQITNILYR